MLYRGQRVDKKQTKIVEQSRDPIYDQTFEFNILNLMQLSHPMDNRCFDSSIEAMSSEDTNVLDKKVSSRIQFILLVMDWDQVEKNDVIGKIELNTQNHLQRLINNQSQSNNTNASSTESNNNKTEDNSKSGTHLNQQNWFDIFYQPGIPLLCTFQIKNY